MRPALLFDTTAAYRYNSDTVTTESTRTDEGGSTPSDTEPQSTTETVLAEAEQAIEEAGQLTVGLIRDIFVGVIAYFGEIFLLLWQSLRGLTRGINVTDVIRQM
jgi:hypothetical protein